MSRGQSDQTQDELTFEVDLWLVELWQHYRGLVNLVDEFGV
jgi:hypothetical protein